MKVVAGVQCGKVIGACRADAWYRGGRCGEGFLYGSHVGFQGGASWDGAGSVFGERDGLFFGDGEPFKRGLAVVPKEGVAFFKTDAEVSALFGGLGEVCRKMAGRSGGGDGRFAGCLFALDELVRDGR